MISGTHNSIGIRPALLFVLLIPGIVWAQDLEAHWQNYLTIEAEVDLASESEGRWVERREELRIEIRELQNRQAWHNGWIIELLIARKSSLQVELADSLIRVRNNISRLKAQQAEAFSALKRNYQQILLASEARIRLSRSQKEQAITIGGRLLGTGAAAIDLPDYTSILDSQYESGALKRLVFEDLQSVIQTKLVLIDALLAEKQTEIALLNRLNEFHRDLGYQRKSDLDLQGSGSSAATARGVQDLSSNVPDEAPTLVGKAFGYTGGDDLNRPSSVSQNPMLSGKTDIPSNLSPIGEAIERLIRKRQQYLDLLQRIEAELPH